MSFDSGKGNCKTRRTPRDTHPFGEDGENNEGRGVKDAC